MTRATTMLVSGFVSAAVLAGAAQTGLDPAKLLKPGTEPRLRNRATMPLPG